MAYYSMIIRIAGTNYSMNRDYSILIGANGWMHPEWETTYYPDDLPQDWLLGYYSNDFPVVMVTEKEWQSSEYSGKEAIEDWVDNSEVSLRFVLELSAELAEFSKWREKLSGFGHRLFGVVLVFEELPTVEQFKALYTGWQKHYPVCMDFKTAEPGKELSEALAEVGVGWCWHGGENSQGINNRSLAIARIETENKTPRDLRAMLETMLAVDSTEQKVVLFEGTPPSLEVINNTGIILDLL